MSEMDDTVRPNNRSRSEGKRIAFFMHDFGGGGIERNRINLAQGFLGRGAQVDIIVVKADGPLRKHVPNGVRVIELGVVRLHKAVAALCRYLRRERPDILIASNESCNVRSIVAKHVAGSPAKVFVTTHGSVFQRLNSLRRRRSRWSRVWLPRLLYPFADGVVGVSRDLADDIARVIRMPRSQIHVIYNPALTPQVCTLAAERLCHPWFQTMDIPIMLGVGRLTLQKDFPTLIRAFAIARAERCLRLVILGDGPERSKLERIVGELGIGDDVELLGFVPNPFAFMARASVLVLSSVWEGFGNVLVEALACGCPVVSTDCPNGPREVLADGKYGRLVPMGDHERLARAVLEVLARPPAPEVLRQRAMDFHVDKIIERYCEALDI